MWVFFALCTVGGVRMILTGRLAADPPVTAVVGIAPGREWVAERYCWLGVAVFAAFTAYFACRAFCLGTGYLLYDRRWRCLCSAAGSAGPSVGGTWRPAA